MATEKQRAMGLDKDIAGGGKAITRILRNSQRSVNGTIKQYTSLPNYITNAAVRNRLYTQLASEYKALNGQVNKWVENEATDTSRKWWSYAKEDAPVGATTGTAAATFGKFSEKYVSDIIGFINPATVDSQVALNAQIGGMLTSDIRALRAAVSTTMAEGAVEGLTNKQMSERMISKINKSTGGFTFVDKAGRKWTADSYFGMLNRTLHASSARQSYINTSTKELGLDLYQIEGGVTGSSVDNANDPCDRWAGRIISMTGSTSGYPTYAEAVAAGVFHPNCVHFVRALLPSEIPEAKVQQAEERKIARELGGVSAKTTKEAEVWAKDNLNLNKVDYSGLDIDFANRVNADLSSMKDKYPEDFAILKSVSTKSGGKSAAELNILSTKNGVSETELVLSENLFSNKKSIDGLNRDYLRVDKNGLPFAVGGADSTIIHEFGHNRQRALFNRINKSNSADELFSTFQGGMREISKGGGLPSVYSGKNTSELFAEAFTEIETMPRAKWSRATIKVNELFERVDGGLI